jgi:hypothetical protein
MLKMKRTNKEIKINVNDLCDVSYGTTNKYQPKVIYLSCKTWVEPEEEKEFNSIIENIFINFKKELFKEILKSNFFDKNFISNFEIKSSSLQIHKKNFFNFEIYLKQKSKILLLPDLEENVIDLFKPLINDLIADFQNNSLNLSKGKH